MNILAEIYNNRQFRVADQGTTSAFHDQLAGIFQGCPLSPYLFVMVMTVLLRDARELLKEEYGIELDSDELNELVCADDTLLMGTQPEYIQKYMQYIAAMGYEYGLSLNLKKVEQLNVNCTGNQIIDEAGDAITIKSSLKYLGAVLHSSGLVDSEIAQKIGEASANFKVLQKIWNHIGISIKFKFIVFNICTIQKLFYSLETWWLTKSHRRRLNYFFCKYLRSILRISPSQINRVSNNHIWHRFKTTNLSTTLLKCQLILFKKLLV